MSSAILQRWFPISPITAGDSPEKRLLSFSPGNTREVADIVKLCKLQKIPVVPQGGNTGLVLGSVPDTSGKAVVLSLRRPETDS